MKLELFNPDLSTPCELPFLNTLLPAGFPSPAEDYIQNRLDLNQLLIKNQSTTFFARVSGTSMKGANIEDSDILIIDRSLKASNNSIVVAVVNAEFTVKRFIKKGKKAYLVPANDQYEEMELNEFLDFEVWGVVTYIIKKAV